MIFRKHVNNLTTLQTINLLRFITFFIIGIILAKNGYTKTQIGKFELTILIVNVVSFFWVYGIIHSLLTLYNNNSSFSDIKRNRKSPEIFNAFILLFCFNLFLLLIFVILLNYLNLFGREAEKFPFTTIIVLNIFFANPSSLIEYIYIYIYSEK